MSSKPPIYFTARELIDPETRERVLALRPSTYTDAQQPAWVRLRPGDRRRGQITAVRSPGYNKFAHKLGKLATRNIDELAHLEPHAALKRLQAEAGVECDMVMLDAETAWREITERVLEVLPGEDFRHVLNLLGELMAGKQLAVKWPRSMSSDSMDEDTFRAVVRAICGHLSSRYWPTCTPEEIEAMAELHIDGHA